MQRRQHSLQRAAAASRKPSAQMGSTQLAAWLLLLSLGTATAAGRGILEAAAAADDTAAAAADGSAAAAAVSEQHVFSSSENSTSSKVPKFTGHSRLQAQKHMQHLSTDAFIEVPDRLLIIAQHRENISWLDELAHVPHIVYQADNSSALRSPLKNMREAAVYLQYIVEHYDKLPKWMAFMHAHQCSEHMPNKVPVLQNLQWGRFEYANLRYENITLNKWGGWTGDWLHPGQPQVGPGRTEVVWTGEQVQLSALYAQLWEVLFAGELGRMPEWVHSPCCAEFVVSKARVRAHPRRFYVDVLDWLTYSTEDHYNAGLLLEYTWHLVFGEPAVYHAPPKCDLLQCEGVSSS